MKCNKRQNSSETKPNKHQKVLETIIKNATQMWCSNPIHLRNPLQLLQLSSHCINDVYMEASQVHFISSDQNHSSGNDEDRYSSKINSTRKNKSSTSKDCRRMYATNATQVASTSTSTTPTACVQEIPIPIDMRPPPIEITTKSEPPPLAFYPKNRTKLQQPIIFSATEPPPLVPITRTFA